MQVVAAIIRQFLHYFWSIFTTEKTDNLFACHIIAHSFSDYNYVIFQTGWIHNGPIIIVVHASLFWKKLIVKKVRRGMVSIIAAKI